MTSNQNLDYETIDNIVNTIPLSASPLSIDEQRANFKFPKDFSFKDEKFREQIDHLYGRKHFSINYTDKLKELVPKLIKSKSLQELKDNSYNLIHVGQVERKAKRKVRQDYHLKIKEYFIEHHNLPKGVAYLASGMMGLPKCKEHKTFLDYALNALPSAVVGNLSKLYVDPMAKLMNVEPKFITASSIIYDAINFAGVGYWAFSMWTGEQGHVGPMEQLVANFYGLFDAGETILKWLLTANTATRFIEIPVRIGYYIDDKSHTLSPASAFPLNPNFVDGPFFTYLLGYDLVKKAKETDTYKSTIDTYKKIKHEFKSKLPYFSQSKTKVSPAIEEIVNSPHKQYKSDLPTDIHAT